MGSYYDGRIMDFIFEENEKLKETIKSLKKEISDLNKILDQYKKESEKHSYNLIGD